MRRELGQLSLVDGLVEGGAGRNRQLEQIAAGLRSRGARRRRRGDRGPTVLRAGGPAQVPAPAAGYRLADRGLAAALSDRRSFRRFVGLALADPVPDHATLSRFRSELSRRGLAEQLLAELNRQLDAKGLMVKTGTLIDVSLVAADCRRPRKDEPVEGRSDQDASWNAMPKKPLFGYKMHLAVDQGSGLVRRAMLTPGHVSDKVPFLDLVQGDAQAVGACPRAGLRPDPGPVAATTAGGTARSWPRAASRTASLRATTSSGRSMPRAARATGRSG